MKPRKFETLFLSLSLLTTHYTISPPYRFCFEGVYANFKLTPICDKTVEAFGKKEPNAIKIFLIKCDALKDHHKLEQKKVEQLICILQSIFSSPSRVINRCVTKFVISTQFFNLSKC